MFLISTENLHIHVSNVINSHCENNCIRPRSSRANHGTLKKNSRAYKSFPLIVDIKINIISTADGAIFVNHTVLHEEKPNN